MERVILALFVTLLVIAVPSTFVLGHGRLADPPSRNAMWMYGFKNPVNNNPNENNCGGTKNQWTDNGGKCGLCGDPYQGPRRHEAGYPGGYANGVIGRVYKQGQTINIMVEITANHFGWFEFRLCPNNDPKKAVTQQCFDKYVLPDHAGNTRHRLYLEDYKGTVKFQLVLPSDVVCSQCVLQWFWYAGNSRDRIAQETFVNCADVVITKSDGTLPAGMKMPEIPARAYEPIPETKARYGEGKIVDLPGEWDCIVPPPYTGTPKEKVFHGWCMENCLFSPKGQRSCPVETCRCFRTDVKMAVDEERRLLGITDPYPVMPAPGSTAKTTGSYLEGDWVCEVVPPFDKDPVEKRQYKEWCTTHCLLVAPHDRDCPETLCECHRTDKRLSAAEEKKLLQKTSAPTSTRKATGKPQVAYDPRDKSWKNKATIKPKPNGLPGSWDCDVKEPYVTQLDKRLSFYEWCVENCINSPPHDRYCAESHCDCYRTDVKQSRDENLSQLGGSSQVIKLSDRDDEKRGIPPSLLNIVKYAGEMKNIDNKQPGLEGSWDCEVLFPYNRDAARKAMFYKWCNEHCIQAQPNDRYCPDTHCRCFRTDRHQSDAENKRQLAVGMSVQNIIHAESGEDGTLAKNTGKPQVGGMSERSNPGNRYVCEVVPPYNDSRKESVLKYCYESCVNSIETQRDCPTSHCKCYEKTNPNNVLKTYQANTATRNNSILKLRNAANNRKY